MATIAREPTGSRSQITGAATSAKNEIVTAKLQRFGGLALLVETIRQIVEAMARA